MTDKELYLLRNELEIRTSQEGLAEACRYLDMSLDFCQNPVLQIDAEDRTGDVLRPYSLGTKNTLCNEGL